MRTFAVVSAALLTLGSAVHAQTLVVLNKSDDTASLIDPSTREVVRTVRVGNAPHEVAISPDGATAVVCDYGDRENPGTTLTVFRIDEASAPRTIDLGEYRRPHGIRYLQDGRRVVVTAELEERLLVVDIESGAIERAYETGHAGSHMVALTPDERWAVTANIGDGTATLIDLSGQEKNVSVLTGRGAEGVAMRPGTSEAWVTNRSADTVSVIDVDRQRVVADFDCGIFPIRIAFTEDGSHALVSCAQSGAVSVIDADSRRAVKRVQMKSRSVEQQERDKRLFGDRFGMSPVPVGILIEPGGERAYVANTNADVVTVIDLRSLEIEGRLVAGSEPDGLGWSALDPAR